MSSVIIQPEEATTWFTDSTPTTTDGVDEYILVHNGVRRCILKFDFSSVPDGVKIDSATLSVYFFSQTGTVVGRTYMARRITETGWIETQASWNNYKSGSAWAAAGGDYTTDLQASAVVGSLNSWIEWDVQGIVQVALGSAGKIGHFIIMDADETGGFAQAVIHNLRYTTDTSLRPKLAITYSTIDLSLKAKPDLLYGGVKESFAKDGWSNKKNYFIQQADPFPCVVQYIDLFVDTTNE